ncbi:hypothetical protein DPMN_121867 [Dreissena polymorpha]|uniref:Sushi domain-containing protein n=1 Tax=Dreissena polymorpha TaxID=45954 RepID=A0A9D4GQV9_DREPO|nr:hypothetical protein DPMN_121867 [Dreissena polymorpha]
MSGLHPQGGALVIFDIVSVDLSAGCAKPEGDLVNMEKQFYDDGETISITDRNCETGYVPSSGDITLTCKSGQWSKEISCVPGLYPN